MNMPELQEQDRPVEYTDEDRRREALFVMTTVHQGCGTGIAQLMKEANRVLVYLQTGNIE